MAYKMTRRNLVFSLVVLVLIAGAVYAALQAGEVSDAKKYEGLTLTREVEMTEEERLLLSQRIETSKAAIEAQEAQGDVDWNLYEVLAQDYYFIGDLVGARETTETYLALNALNYTVWNNYGTILRQMGDYEGAEDAYAQALELKATQENIRDYVTLLQVAYPDGSRDEDIRRLLEAGVEILGQQSWLMLELGDWYFAHGMCDKSVDHYEVAKTMNPEDEEIADLYKKAKTECVE